MSRSALLVIVLLLGVGALALWWRPTPDPVTPPPPSVSAPVPAPPTPALPDEPAPAAPVIKPADIPVGERARVGNADNLGAFLSQHGINGPQAVAAYKEWRLARGLTQPDPVSGIDSDEPRASYYDNLDQTVIEGMARSGDAGALRALAMRQLPRGLVEAVESLGASSRAGSAGAMLELATLFGALGDAEPGEISGDQDFMDRLDKLRGTADRDLREDALSWQLAAIRQHGPAVVDSSLLEDINARADQLPPERLLTACAQSLAILADISAEKKTPGSRDALPATFVSPENLYARLPCSQTAAPVVAPTGLSACRSWPAQDGGGAPIQVWSCAAP